MDQETIEPEFEEIKNEYEIKINDSKLRIEINNDEIKFILIIGISHYKYIKEYKYDEIIKELNISNKKDINEVYELLINSEYKIIKEEKKIIINNNKEIILNEKIIKNEEMIQILINEIKEIKDRKDKENQKIVKLINMNEEKENRINILENKYNELKEKLDELEENKKDIDEINLMYYTTDEGNYNIFGKKFVENNKDNIEISINGKKKNFLINEYKLIKN